METRAFYSDWDDTNPEVGFENTITFNLIIVSTANTFFFRGDAISYITINEDGITVCMLDGTSKFNFPWAIIRQVRLTHPVGFIDTLNDALKYILGETSPSEEEAEEDEEEE